MPLMRRCILCSVAATILVLGLAGCKNKPEAPRFHVLKGHVTKIDAASGVVTGMFWIEKQNDTIELSGKLAPDAEIFINGRTAGLEDVQIGDSVEVTGTEEKHNSDRRLIAKRVQVIRMDRTSQPASKPAEAPAAP